MRRRVSLLWRAIAFVPVALAVSAAGVPLAPITLGIAPGDTMPRDVSVATGPVRYTVTRAGIDGAVGHLLVQMLDDQRIRAELVAPASAPAARTYVR